MVVLSLLLYSAETFGPFACFPHVASPRENMFVFLQRNVRATSGNSAQSCLASLLIFNDAGFYVGPCES